MCISQLKLDRTVCGSYLDIPDIGLLLTWKILNQRYLVAKLKSLLRNFTVTIMNWITVTEYLSQMTTGILPRRMLFVVHYISKFRFFIFFLYIYIYHLVICIIVYVVILVSIPCNLVFLVFCIVFHIPWIVFWVN